MKNFIKKLMLFLGFMTPIFSALDPDKVDDLEKFTMDLFDQLSEDEKKQVMEEALKLEEYIKNLPPEEQRALEQELENEVQNLMDSGALKEMSKEELITPPVVDPVVSPKEDTKETLKFASDIPALKKQLKEISKLISNLSLKIEEPGKMVASDLEESWKFVKDPLIESQSYILSISNNDKLMDSLLSSEYKILKTQLDDFYTDIIKRDKESEKSSIISSIIDTFEKHISTNQILWGLKRFLQKFAPQEIKDDKKTTPIKQTTPQDTYQPSYPQYPSYPSYPASRDSGAGYASGGRGGYVPPHTSDTPSKPGLTPPQQKNVDKPSRSTSRTGPTRPTDKKTDKKPEEKKPAEKGKPDDKAKKPKRVSPVKKEQDDLKKYMKNITESMEKNDIIKDFEFLEKNLISTKRSPSISEEKVVEINNIITKANNNLIRMEELLKEPAKTSKQVDDKLKKIPKQSSDSERAQIIKIIEDRKFKFKELGESLNRLASEDTGTRLINVPPTIQQTFEPFYTQLKSLNKTYQDIVDHLKGQFKEASKTEKAATSS
jgi:hypothetical protein